MLVISMLIYGTIGVVRRAIPLPSGFVAMTRGFIGMLALLLIMALRRRRPDFRALRAKLFPLLLSGACLGLNWILLFEAYQHTTVAAATLCYYMAPVFVILLSPWLMRERLTPRKALCVAAALVGMVLVSGVWKTGAGGGTSLRGALFGLGAALLYTGVVLLNMRMPELDAYDKTAVQLAVAGLVLLPYTALTEPLAPVAFTPAAIWLLLLLGVVHTGLAYALYFGSMRGLPAQTVALYSYIDPVVAVLLSALVLRESMGAAEIIGAVLILAAAMLSELKRPA